MYKITLMILVSILVLSGCGGGEQEAVPVGKAADQHSSQEESNMIETTVDINQSNQGITFDLHVNNKGDEEITFVFSSSKKYEIVVKNEKGKQVYNSSEGKMYTQAFQEVTVKPGKKLSWSETWQPSRLAPGTYEVSVEVISSEIKPAPGEKVSLQTTKTFEIK